MVCRLRLCLLICKEARRRACERGRRGEEERTVGYEARATSHGLAAPSLPRLYAAAAAATDAFVFLP
jgi:hypothetical protein